MGFGSHSAKEPDDAQTALIKKLHHAFDTFHDATKEYMTAVRGVDGALERLAIAFRELSQGELPDAVRRQVDGFGAAVGGRRSASVTRRPSDAADYPLAVYMDDFAKHVTAVVADLRTSAKAAGKSLDERNAAAERYNAARAEADRVATKDVKRNRNSSENPKYQKLVQKRDALRKKAEEREKELDGAYRTLLERRAELVGGAMQSMGTESCRYWNAFAQSMQLR